MPPLGKEIIVYVSTNEGRSCPLEGCNFTLDMDTFQENCTHLLQHGLMCLHVGQETTYDSDGKPWHNTVAVFGK
jgi:hypothetical protein